MQTPKHAQGLSLLKEVGKTSAEIEIAHALDLDHHVEKQDKKETALEEMRRKKRVRKFKQLAVTAVWRQQ